MASPASLCLDEHEIAAFVNGELDASRRRVAMGHVDHCESCRLLVAELLAEKDADADLRSHGEPPEIIDGRFRLGDPIGSGAMGTVYRARDEKLGVDVALKLLHATSPDERRALARELTVGRRVTHPNVCRLHDAGEHEGAAYLTMALVEGQTLGELLAQGPLPASTTRRILEGIAAGLAAVHAQGIVHRDLKPANVLVDRESGEPVLTDFGFAADLETKQSRRLVGTPSFWSPEQARGERVTPASDVYSFGVLAYRLLAGREFSLSDPRALDDVPRTYRALVRRCLEPRPGARFADGRDLARALAATSHGASGRWLPLSAGTAALAGLALLATKRTPADDSPPPTSATEIATGSAGAPLPPVAASAALAPVAASAALAPAVATSAPPPADPREPPFALGTAQSGRPAATATPARHPPIMSAPRPRPAPPAASAAASTAGTAPPADDPLFRH